MNHISYKGEYILRTAKIQIFQNIWEMFSEEVPDNRFTTQTGEISFPDLLALLQINPAPDFRTQRSKIPPDLRRMSQNPQKRDSIRCPDRTVNLADFKFRHRRGKFGTQSFPLDFTRFPPFSASGPMLYFFASSAKASGEAESFSAIIRLFSSSSGSEGRSMIMASSIFSGFTNSSR